MNSYSTKHTNEETIAIVTSELKRIGIIDNPSSSIYAQKRNKEISPSATTVSNRFGGWVNFCERYLEQPTLNTQTTSRLYWNKYSDKELLNIILTELERIGEDSYKMTMAKYTELYDMNNSPSVKYICKRFKGWKKLIEKIEILRYNIRRDLGLQAINELKRIGIERYPSLRLYEKKRNKEISPSVNVLAKYYGSWDKFVKYELSFGRDKYYQYYIEPKWRKYSKKQITKIIKEELERIGDPGKVDIIRWYAKLRDPENAPSLRVIRAIYGDWTELFKYAKLKRR